MTGSYPVSLVLPPWLHLSPPTSPVLQRCGGGGAFPLLPSLLLPGDQTQAGWERLPEESWPGERSKGAQETRGRAHSGGSPRPQGPQREAFGPPVAFHWLTREGSVLVPSTSPVSHLLKQVDLAPHRFMQFRWPFSENEVPPGSRPTE